MANEPTLSARAQEILRRADAQLEALRAPAEPTPEPSPAPVADADPGPSRPEEIRDLGGLVDAVQSGVEAAAAHLVALSEAVERIAEEIETADAGHRRTLPPQLEAHARLPEDTGAREAETEPDAEPEPVPEERAPSAANDAARLVAIEMAVAGDTREGVGRRLREEFGIRDPKRILDDAFGREPGGPGSRAYGA